MTLRAVLVGLGVMGRNHHRVLTSLEGVTLVGIVDDREDQMAIQPSVERFLSAEEIPSDFADIAIVATPTATHERISLELAARGMHVLVEKPISDSSSSGEVMSRRFGDSGLVGAVGHIERFNPAIGQLKARLAAGEIGEIYQISTRRQGSFPGRIADVGVVKDLATHDIDITTWISGSSYKTVSSEVALKSGRDHEDMLVAVGRLNNGVMFTHTVNWLSPMKERVVIVTGDKGTFVADTLTGDLTLHENGAFRVEWDSFASFRGVTEGDVTRLAFAKKEPLIAELEGFRDCVRGQGKEIVTFAEGARVVKVAEMFLESALNNRSAYFEEPSAPGPEKRD